MDSHVEHVGENGTSWRCVIENRDEVGRGRARHVRYFAQLTGPGQPARPIQFRFSELVSLRAALARVPELHDVALPVLPPKVTFRSLVQGQFDQGFQAERQPLVQRFLEEMFTAVSQKYVDVGDAAELCEPLGVFLTRSSERGVAAEVAAVAAAVRAAEVVEDRDIIDQQNAEYEESLRRDREAEERARAAQQAAADAEAEERRLVEDAQRSAAAAEEQRLQRRSAFEASHAPPAAGEPQAAIKFRKADGESISRAFSPSTTVEALFEFAYVAEWQRPPPVGFDLRTSFPVRSLQGERSQSLQQAGLCPSAALVVAIEDD